MGTVTAKSHGRITDTIVIPTVDPSGVWVLTTTGAAADGGTRVDSTLITITPP